MKYCDKTNADHVSLFLFLDKVKHWSVFDQWVKFVAVTWDPHSWSRSADYMYVCNDHFTSETYYENFTNLKYGYQTITKLNKETAMPSKRPVPTSGQLVQDNKKFGEGDAQRVSNVGEGVSKKVQLWGGGVVGELANINIIMGWAIYSFGGI